MGPYLQVYALIARYLQHTTEENNFTTLSIKSFTITSDEKLQPQK